MVKNVITKHSLIFLLYTLVAFICYGHVITGPFLFDDQLNIELNTYIRSFSSFFEIFSSSSVAGSHIEGSNFFRPIKTLVYTLLYHFFELNPIPYHIVPIFLHISNAFLIFSLLKRLSFSVLTSCFMGLIFCVHPILIEAVSYVSGIADPLGVFFVLLGLSYFEKISTQSPWKTIAISTAFFILALLSKENMIVFFLLAFLLFLFHFKSYTKDIKKKKFIALLIYTIIAFTYLVLKLTVLDFTGNIGLTGTENIYTQSLFIRINTFIHVLWDYAVLLLFPKHLFLEKPYVAYADLFDPRGLFGYGIILISIYACFRSFFRKGIIFLGIGWFFAAISPVIGIIPLNAMYLEHWLYLPIIGLLIVLGAILDSVHTQKKRFVVVALLTAFIIGFGLRSIQRNYEWRDPIAFYLNELNYSKKNSRIHNNLAMEYSELKDYQKAIIYFNKAIEYNPSHPEIYYNLGISYEELGNLPLAIRYFKESIKTSPTFIYPYVKLSDIYTKLGNKNKAIYYYLEAQKVINKNK